MMAYNNILTKNKCTIKSITNETKYTQISNLQKVTGTDNKINYLDIILITKTMKISHIPKVNKNKSHKSPTIAQNGRF